MLKHIPAHLTAIAGPRYNLPALSLLAPMHARHLGQGGLLVGNIFQTPSSYRATIIPSIQQVPGENRRRHWVIGS
jgi:hypothetical protein